jgi:xanthine dehydrogenase large subunit
MKVEDNILAAAAHAAGTDLVLPPRAAPADRRLERHQPGHQARLALTPVKFGISFTATLFNQAGALVHVYTDGSVLVNHGGTEMGQGLNTKVAQIVADELGVPVRARAGHGQRHQPRAQCLAPPPPPAAPTSTARPPSSRPRHVRDNLAALWRAGRLRRRTRCVCRRAGDQRPGLRAAFRRGGAGAYANRIQLWSDGFYRTPKIHYDKTTLHRAAVLLLRLWRRLHRGGHRHADRREPRAEGGHPARRGPLSINPALDIGQIEGGFVQGMGWLTTEELVWNDNGPAATHAPSTYKIPRAGDQRLGGPSTSRWTCGPSPTAKTT